MRYGHEKELLGIWFYIMREKSHMPIMFVWTFAMNGEFDEWRENSTFLWCLRLWKYYPCSTSAGVWYHLLHSWLGITKGDSWRTERNRQEKTREGCNNTWRESNTLGKVLSEARLCINQSSPTTDFFVWHHYGELCDDDDGNVESLISFFFETGRHPT